jgi:hypothetical protein
MLMSAVFNLFSEIQLLPMIDNLTDNTRQKQFGGRNK